jgi:hypothetical protein
MTATRRAPVRRFGLLTVAVLSGMGTLLWASSGRAAEKARKSPAAACVAAWSGAAARSEAGHLREARDLLLSCARPTCRAATMRQCSAKLVQLDSDIPTVVPVVTTEAGEPVIDVEVRSGGELLASRLDGRGLLLDPGLHELSFSVADRGVFATRKLLILEGQRNRTIAVSLPNPTVPSPVAASAPAAGPELEKPAPGEAAVATPPEPPPRGGKRVPSPLVLALGGGGLASVGAGALLTFWGNRDNAALSSCSPTCLRADTDHIRALYLASDITFGAGAAMLGLAAVLFVTTRSRAEEHPPRAAFTLSLEPMRSGPFASVKGTF